MVDLCVELASKEDQHQRALMELEDMKRNMEEMEQERSQMVAEVEAQIERALASMAFSDGDGYSDYSRPPSALSGVSGEGSHTGHSGIGMDHSSIGIGHSMNGALRHAESGPALRSASARSAGSGSMASDQMDGSSRLRSMTTATSIADDASDEVTRVGCELSGLKEEGGYVKEGPITMLHEEDPTLVMPIGTNQRFSASKHEGVDGFGAVDHGISERSDVVAMKVQQIQQKVG